MISKHLPENYWLGLDSTEKHLFEMDLSSLNTDACETLNVDEVETNISFDVEEEPHMSNNVFHSGYKIIGIDLDREWTAIIAKHLKNAKNVKTLNFLKVKTEVLN